MIVESSLASMASELSEVPGVVGVMLGGSRARGDHHADSDVDLGLYYDHPLDLDALGQLASRLADEPVEVAGPGGWGQWVDGGAWLSVEGQPVDWILRDVARVREQCTRARAGRFGFHAQVGHPLGFLDVSYAGELALGRILADGRGLLTELRAEVTPYPPALTRALVGLVGEAEFLIDVAGKAVGRSDSVYVGHCLSRALLLCAHALHADAGRWVVNEKGLIPGVDRLPASPHRFSERAAEALATLGTDPASRADALGRAGELVAESRASVTG